MIPSPGSLYKHFKGSYYRVIGVGTHTETGERLVIYHKEGDSKLWVRPLDMFSSKVDHDKYPDVEQTYRFQKIDEEGVWL